MFQIGEYVVHGNDGICEVKDITQLELPGGSSKRNIYTYMEQVIAAVRYQCPKCGKVFYGDLDTLAIEKGKAYV